MRRSITKRHVLLSALIAWAALAWTMASSFSALAASPLKIVSFNLYNRPWQREARLQNALETLSTLNADIIALQEVATGWILPGDPVPFLAEGLGMTYVARAWHEENLGVFRTGLAILSRYPLEDIQYREFAEHRLWDAKGYQSVRVRTPEMSFRFLNLHMASTTNEDIRKSEWEEITGVVQSLSAAETVVLAGDFNTEPEHPALKSFKDMHVTSSSYDAITSRSPVRPSELRTWTDHYWDSCAGTPGKNPMDSGFLDYIFVVGPQLKVTDARIVAPERVPHASDHCPIVAELEGRPAERAEGRKE